MSQVCFIFFMHAFEKLRIFCCISFIRLIYKFPVLLWSRKVEHKLIVKVFAFGSKTFFLPGAICIPYLKNKSFYAINDLGNALVQYCMSQITLSKSGRCDRILTWSINVWLQLWKEEFTSEGMLNGTEEGCSLWEPCLMNSLIV